MDYILRNTNNILGGVILLSAIIGISILFSVLFDKKK
jgi:hypothetical protein